MFRRLFALIRKEFFQLRRNPIILRMIIFVPVFQMTIFGYAAILEVNNIKMAVLDRDNSDWSRRLTDTFRNSNYFNIIGYLESEKELLKLFHKTEIQAAIIIPPDFSANIKKGQTAKVQLIIDGVNSNVASAAMGYSIGCVNDLSLKILKNNSSQLPAANVIKMENRYMYNPSLKNTFFFIPGVFAMVIMVMGMPITAMSIVREKEEGTYEQLIVTPIRSAELIAGKIIPIVILISLVSVILLGVSLFWFGLPLRGNPLILAISVIVFLINVLGMGIFVSAISNSQYQAMLTCVFLLMPMVLFSGFMFPIENMPPFFKLLAYLDPMTHLLNIARNIFLKGSGFQHLAKDFYTLCATGLIIFITSMTLVRKRSD